MTSDVFLIRRPMLGRDCRFSGYSFSCSRPEGAAAYRQLFAALAAEKPPGGTCFIHDNGPAFDELIEEIPENVAVVLAPRRAELVPRLKQRHVPVCVRVASPVADFPASLSASDHVWVDSDATEPLGTLIKTSQRLPGKRIIAGVESRETFDEAKETGAHLFSGDWYEKIVGAPRKSVSPGQATVLELINLAQTEAPLPQIEQLLKRDATLSFRLLRYINSAGFGLSCEIQSFRHAVSILGYQNLGRWLALLLATSGNSATAPVLMREAAARGRFTEMVGENFIAAEERDNLFIVGVFSLLPAILQMPIDQLVGQLNLAESVNDALVDHSGLYGPILRLAQSIEILDVTGLERVANDMQLSAAQVNRLHLEALAWANRLAA